MKELTVKQERYVQGLFKGLSQRQAYKEAYNAENMKDESIDNNAYRLCCNIEITSRLKELQQEEANKSKWTRERLIKEFEDLKQLTITMGEFPTSAKSLENIGKLLGMYTEKIQHSGNIGVRIVDDIEEDEEDDEDE